MGAGTLALTMMCLLLGQAPEDVPHTNQRALRIPININDSLRSELRELLLYSSFDQGRTYQQVAKVLPDKNEFVYEARNDGVCWLKIAVLNRQGRQEPDNIQQGPPDQKIVIDTMKPVVKTFTAQRDRDEVVIVWEILEEYLDARAFRLEYQPKDNASSFWTAIPGTPGLTGQARFRPTSASPLAVRMIAKDLGGNQSFAYAEVSGGINAVGYNPPAAPAPAPSNLVPAVLPPPAPPPSVEFPKPMPPPAPIETAKPPAPPPNTWAPAPTLGDESKERVIASSEAPRAPLPPAAAPAANDLVAASSARKPLPPLQYVNHPEVMLEYELAKVGKSGIGSVDLWWTQNDGQTWEPYAVDKDIKGSTQNGKQQRTVELPGEGLYGFILVVKSRAGLGKPPPRPGDVPDIRVEVDTRPPVAKLYPPCPDPQHVGALILRWAAKDNNLTNNPITLEWAENREGEWHSIADAIPNTGQYSWRLPDTLPVQVYLRLRVRDLAGNECVAATRDPEMVDLSEPEGRLLNATVMPRRP